MKIAFFDAFPHLAISAEREFIMRSIQALKTMGHEAVQVTSSAQIEQQNPDIVFYTHDLITKLTHHFGVGFLWSPTAFYRDVKERCEAIRSWDLVLPINRATEKFARDLHFPARHATAVSTNIMMPTANNVDVELPDLNNLTLTYMGVHWDGRRHNDVLSALEAETKLVTYGPQSAWQHYEGDYRGPIALGDGSIVSTLNRHGIVLAIHKPEHRDEDTPSMRIFEACAAKCLVITDPLPTIREIFGDAVEYVDASLPPEEVARQISEIVREARTNTEQTKTKILQAHKIFCERVSLEALYPPVLKEVAQRIAHKNEPVRIGDTVSVIMRVGSRPLDMIKRAVASISAQTYQPVQIIFAQFKRIDGFDEFADSIRSSSRFQGVKIVSVPLPGNRSASMWAGLNAVDTPYFAILDDDDEWFADHLGNIMNYFRSFPESDVVHSGGIQNEEELNEQLPDRLPESMRGKVVEPRSLRMMKAFDSAKMMTWENYMLSHSFVARSHFLSPDVLDDPGLDVGEDVYLYFMYLSKGAKIRFNGFATAVWNFRSISKGNSTVVTTASEYEKSGRAIRLRLSNSAFVHEMLGGDVIGNGFVTHHHSTIMQSATPTIPQIPKPAKPRNAVHLMRDVLRVIRGRPVR